MQYTLKWLPGLTSQTFNADQFWFRIISGLLQRCSLPENLWTALIQLWTTLKTKNFRAKNQRCFSADFLTASTTFGSLFNFFDIFGSTSSFEAHNSDFQPNVRKEVSNQNLGIQSSYGPKIKQKLESSDFLLLLK